MSRHWTSKNTAKNSLRAPPQDLRRGLRRALLPSLLAISLGACGGVTRLPQTAQETLIEAERLLENQKAGEARDLLLEVDPSSYRGRSLQRYEITLATAYLEEKDYWTCYTTLKDFARKYPSSPYYRRSEKLLYTAGARLAATGWTFMGLWSDLTDAQSILEHFIAYYPSSVYYDDALRILGEAAYKTGNYDRAISRFGQLLQTVQDSEWAELAHFFHAMSYFKKLTGPDYDMAAMQLAQRELAGYLRSGSQNEAHLLEARRAFSTTLFWIQSKKMRIARFYLVMENGKGAKDLLTEVMKDPETPFRTQAQSMMKRAEHFLDLEKAQDASETTQKGGSGG